MMSSERKTIETRWNHLELIQFPMFKDNYGFIIHDHSTSETMIIDPGACGAATVELNRRNWKLTFILITHHHWDHTDGVNELKSLTGASVLGPRGLDRYNVKCDIELSVFSEYRILGQNFKVLNLPGHTLDHLGFYFEEPQWLFCGDTLFAYGCGRLFEGTPEQLWMSLKTVRRLPDTTLVYCAHEYTQTNLAFCQSLNFNLKRYNELLAEADVKRAQSLPTVPFVLGDQKRDNPFLRADDHDWKQALNLPDETDVEVFARLRSLRNQFVPIL